MLYLLRKKYMFEQRIIFFRIDNRHPVPNTELLAGGSADIAN